MAEQIGAATELLQAVGHCSSGILGRRGHLHNSALLIDEIGERAAGVRSDAHPSTVPTASEIVGARGPVGQSGRHGADRET